MYMIIGNININNDHLINDIQGDHGYSGTGFAVTMITRRINAYDGTENDFRALQHDFKVSGFTCSIYTNEPELI